MRNLKFDLDVDTNALLCPNPDEFYSKAYLTEDIADNYRTLPGIKSATKLANVAFGNILKASTCSFTAPNDTRCNRHRCLSFVSNGTNLSI